MEQLSLLGTCRNSDPGTSFGAAAHIVVSKRADVVRQRVWELFQSEGDMTDDVLLARYKELYGHTAESTPRKRRCELVAMGLIRDSGDRSPDAESGRQRIVWRVAESVQ